MRCAMGWELDALEAELAGRFGRAERFRRAAAESRAEAEAVVR